MDISLRTQQLNSLFSYDKKAHLEESRLEIIPFRFTQTIGASEINEFQKGLAATEFCSVTDDHIQENKTFNYTIFAPSKGKTRQSHHPVARTERTYLGKIPDLGRISGRFNRKAGHPFPHCIPYEPHTG